MVTEILHISKDVITKKISILKSFTIYDAEMLASELCLFIVCMCVCVHVGSQGGGGALLFKSQLLDTEGFVWE